METWRIVIFCILSALIGGLGGVELAGLEEGCPDCICPYERLTYERNCRMMSEKIRDQLIRDGYNASILNVYAPHSIVNCSDCREDTELWFDSDGSRIINTQDYILWGDGTNCLRGGYR